MKKSYFGNFPKLKEFKREAANRGRVRKYIEGKEKDAIIYATAKKENAFLLTAHSDFKDKRNVIFRNEIWKQSL